MIITNRTCISFELPGEAKEAEKFRKDNPEAIEAYDTPYDTRFRSFVITNNYSIGLKKGEQANE